MRVLRRRGVYWETYRGSSYTRGRVTKYEDKKVVIDPRRRGSLVKGQCLGNLGGKGLSQHFSAAAELTRTIINFMAEFIAKTSQPSTEASNSRQSMEIGTMT